MQCNEGAGFPLIRKKRKPEISDEERSLQRGVTILESCFRTACFNESIADHRGVMNRRTKIQPQVLGSDRLSKHRGRRLNIPIPVKDLPELRLCATFPAFVA